MAFCSHDKDVTETAIFSNVKVEPLAAITTKPILWSTLETVKIASTDRLVAYTAPEHFEAPNWTRDGTALLINRNGLMHRFTLGGTAAPHAHLYFAPDSRNNDHGLSPDGSMMAVSDQTLDGKSRVYVLPASGGTPRQVTPEGPSYWHGWSPDGKTLAFTDSETESSISTTVPFAGGKETATHYGKGP